MKYGGIEINTTDFGNPVAFIGDEAIEFPNLVEAEEYIDEMIGRDYDKEYGGYDFW